MTGAETVVRERRVTKESYIEIETEWQKLAPKIGIQFKTVSICLAKDWH